MGALTEELIDTSQESAATIARLTHTPGGAFGSARYQLPRFEDNRAPYERLLEVFQAYQIRYFFYNGGGRPAGDRLQIAPGPAPLCSPLFPGARAQTAAQQLPPPPSP